VQDPERFLDAGSDFERALLRGGAAERPSARAVRRMALGAGVGGALSYTSSAQALLETWWGKAAAITVVGGGALVGVVAVVAPGSPPSSEPDRAPAAASPRAPEASPREASQQQTTSEPGSAAQLPAPVAPESAEAVSPKRIARAPQAASTLAEEIKLLDRVRSSMARGDRAAALVALDAYDRRYPDGTLRREASVLRTRASQR